MSHILHLGHQPTDLSGVAGLISTDPTGFDADLDVNALRHYGSKSHAAPFSFPIPEPAGDLWLGVRYVTPHANADSITLSDASFLELYTADATLVAQIKPSASTSRYHAIAHGDTSVEGASTYTATSGQAQWIDIRVAVGADIAIDFHVDGVLHSSATAANTGGKGKPRRVIFANRSLHSSNSSRTWYYAHIAALDGVSTIGRRFARRSPNAVGSVNEMVGGVDALSDGDIATRVASTAADQRLSFSLTGPTGPGTSSAIAGLHLKQIAQAGTAGPNAVAGFLRIGGVNHDAAPVTVPTLAPMPVYSSWALNPADGSPWSTLTLPAEAGIVSV